MNVDIFYHDYKNLSLINKKGGGATLEKLTLQIQWRSNEKKINEMKFMHYQLQCIF